MDKGSIFEALVKQPSVVMIITGVIVLIISSAQIPIGTNVLRVADTGSRNLLGVTGLLLVILGVVLSFRDQIRLNFKKSKISKEHPFFFSRFPHQFKDEFDNCVDVWLTGISFYELMEYADIEAKLRKGHTIKVLLVHPMDYALEIAESRSYRPIDINRRRNEIMNVLKDLCALKQIYNQRLEIRTIKYPLSHKIIAFNPSSPEGILYIHHYAYKPSTTKIPLFKLSSKDNIYYEFFNDELLALWSSAQTWECGI